MPEIIPFNAPDTGLSPTELGVSALTQSAYRANTAAKEVAGAQEQAGKEAANNISSTIRDVGADVVQYQDYQDKSKVSTAATAALLQGEKDIQTTFKGNGKDPSDPDYIGPADPNDPKTAQGFQDRLQKMKDQLTSIPGGKAGSDYALSKADELAQHLATQFQAEAANVSAKQFVLRDQQTTNMLGNLVTDNPTPDNIDLAIKQQGESVDIAKTGGSLTAQQTLDMEAHKQEKVTSLVHAGISSAIMKSADPVSTAKQMLDRYAKYVKPEEAVTITKAADTVAKARIADQKAQRVEAQNAQKDAAYSKTYDYLQQFQSDPEHFSLDKMIQDKAYIGRGDLLKEGVGVIQTLREIREKLSDVDPLQSKSNALGLLQRMDLPDGDPRKLTDRSDLDNAFINKDIGKTEWSELTGRLAKDSEGVDKHVQDSRKRFFTDNAGIINSGSTPVGKQREFEAQQDAIRQEGFLKAKGQDPASLYDPASPNYFGKQLPRFASKLTADQYNPSSSYKINDPLLNKAGAVVRNNIESGGNYAATSKVPDKHGDYAYGAYQVMGKNIAPWTKQYYGRALSKEEFMANHEAQDMVFEGKFGEYRAKYGDEGAARAWYAGEKGMNNLGATDGYGKLTVEQYGRKYMAGLQGLPFVDAKMDATAARQKYAGQTILRSDGKYIKFPALPRPGE